MTHTPQIDALLSAMDELARFLEAENLSIRNRKFDQVKEQTVEKNVLANRYDNLIQAISNDATLLKSLDENERLKIKQAGERLNDRVVENAVLLTAQREATQHVINAFTEAVRESTRSSAGTYARSGAMTHDTVQPKRVAAASINQTL